MKSRLSTALAAAGALTLIAGSGIASAHTGEVHTGAAAAGLTDGIDVPIATSDNVRLLGNFPDTAAISGEFALTGDFFYTSSTDSVSVFDTSDPRNPVLKGTLVNATFENESMTYGERVIDGELNRFVLVAQDLVNVTPTDPSHVDVGGGRVVVVDVTDPSNPQVRSIGEASTSTHTAQCVSRADCTTVYTAGTGGQFSVLDFTDLDNPVEASVVSSPAAGPNGVFSRGAGHYWDFDTAGIGWHTGSGGAAAFDVSDPRNPRILNATDEQGIASPWNDFILHNSMRPNGSLSAKRKDTTPSLANGNVLFVTEEDYFNDGEEVACDQAGSFETWYVPDLDGAAYAATNPDQTVGGGSITPIDRINPVVEGGGGTSVAPVGGFCSAHWFDYHQTGIIAQGYYQQGLRFIDVRDPANLTQYGYFTGGASEVWDAYWVPVRDADGVDTGKKTNVVYTADFVRGIDILEVDLPADEIAPAPTKGGKNKGGKGGKPKK